MLKTAILILGLVVCRGVIPAATAAETAGVLPNELRAMTESDSYVFSHVRDNPATEGVRREVVRFEVDGLNQFALVLWPAGSVPKNGWPVVQFNHGYHPDPPQNGFNASGQSDRPGDYYRTTVQAFVRAGYVVVVPDYRGHNISEGGEFTERMLADAWYTRDAIACFLALKSLPDLNLEEAYMHGHSMGGKITLRALLALGDRVRAAAIWSTSGVSSLPALMGLSLKEILEENGGELGVSAIDNLALELAELGAGVNVSDVSPTAQSAQLAVPLSIHHSVGDAAVPVTNSLELSARLHLAEREYQLKLYVEDDHLFTGEAFSEAVARDLEWFQQHR